MSNEQTRAQRLLIDFLAHAFDVDELRLWLRDELTDDSDPIPLVEGAVPREAFANSVVTGLVRRGLVDSSFFQKLIAKRKKRSEEIMAIAEVWTQARGAVTQAADVSSKNFGNPDLFKLLVKAAGRDFVKSTKAMEVAGGCLVQVSTRERSLDGTWSVAEALSFVPNTRIAERVENGIVVARWLEASLA
jgi:hypothetical protein